MDDDSADLYRIEPSLMPFSKLPKATDVSESWIAPYAPQSSAFYFNQALPAANQISMSQKTLEFVVQGDSDFYTSLKDSYFTFSILQNVAQFSPTIEGKTLTPANQYYSYSNYLAQSMVSQVKVKLNSRECNDEVANNNVTSAIIRDAIMKPRNYSAGSGSAYLLTSMQTIGSSPKNTANNALLNCFNNPHVWSDGPAPNEGVAMINGYPTIYQNGAYGPGQISGTVNTIYSENNGDPYYNPVRLAALEHGAYNRPVASSGANYNLASYYPQVMEVKYVPKVGIFDSDDLIPPNTMITVTITFATTQSMLQASDPIINTTDNVFVVPQNPGPDVYLCMANFWVKRLKLSVVESLRMKELQLARQYIVSMQRSRQIFYTVPVSTTSYRKSNVLSGAKGNIVVIALNTQNSSAGSVYESQLAMSPYCNNNVPNFASSTAAFTSTSIPFVTQAQITLNGMKFPEIPYSTSSPQELQRLYDAYRHCTYPWFDRRGPYLSYEQFVCNYTIFCFDLSKSKEAPPPELHEEITGAHSSIEIFLQFASATTMPINCYVHTISEAGVRLGAFGEVLETINF